MIDRTALGKYVVSFAKLYDGAPGNVQVTAYNTSNWCISDGLISDTLKDVYTPVWCYNGKGQPADTPFTVLYQSRNAQFGNADEGVAFVAGSAVNETYTPTTNTFNSTGGTNTITSSSTAGLYTVALPGLTKAGGDVFVTGTVEGQKPNTIPRCKLVDPPISSNGGISATVQCYGALGPGENEFFQLGYSVGETLGVMPGAKPLGAWAFANNPASTKVYTPMLAYQHNEFGTGSLTAQKTGSRYTITIPGTLSYKTSTIVVTAIGPGSDYCNVMSWTTSAISVGCFRQGGVPADSKFDVLFQTAN
jgi:hypothetical protein